MRSPSRPSSRWPIRPRRPGENVEFTVMYQRGEGKKDGSLVAAQNVKVKDGMSRRPIMRSAELAWLQVCAPEVFVHLFRSNPYTGSGVFVRLVLGACSAGVR
jgi:hypothetical protein